MHVDPGEAVNATEAKFPAISALGYVVAALTLWPYNPRVGKPKVIDNTLKRFPRMHERNALANNHMLLQL